MSPFTYHTCGRIISPTLVCLLLFSDLVAIFIDGLIAFYFARKHRSDEAKWRAIGEDVLVRALLIAYMICAK